MTYLTDSSISLYADDTALFTSSKTQIEIELTLQIKLTVVCEWLRANKLTLNANKTKYVIFGTKQNLSTKPDPHLQVVTVNIECVNSMKYLGVIIDKHLTFDEHITYVINKSSKILSRARDYLNKSAKILLYKSSVLPHLDYCDPIYMCATEENLYRLQQIQNCVCRIVFKADNHTSIKSLHLDLQLPTLKQRRTIRSVVECHNEESGLHNMFKKVECNRVTWSTNSNLIKTENIRTLTGRKAFGFRGPNFWNQLDSETRTIENKNVFKNHISKQMCRDVNHRQVQTPHSLQVCELAILTIVPSPRVLPEWNM